MQPLPTCEQVMTWLSMCPANESTSKKERLYYIVLTSIVTIIIFLSLLASIGYFLKYALVDLENALYTFYQISAFIAMINLIIVGLINRHRIAAIFTELSKLYTANETETSFRFLAEANNKSEWLWKLYFKFGIIGFLANMFVATVASIILCFYKYGAFDADHAFKPYKLLFPWNQHTLYGYIGEFFFSILVGVSYLLINGAVQILFISICWHHQAFYRRFLYTALKLDQPENKRNANEILCELIRIHISAKDWFTQTAEVYSPVVLVQLVCNVIYVAVVVFQLDLRMQHFELDFDIFVLFNATPIGFANLFVYCYFGKLASDSYAKMAECLYESNWHELSPDLQKKVLIMIQNMQQPVYYHGFGFAILNLETFIKFLRAVCTYFMAFKTLNG